MAWRRPVGRAGSGPGSKGTFKIQASDYDPHSLPGCKAIGGRVYSPEWIEEMRQQQRDLPAPVDFVQQMRERKST